MPCETRESRLLFEHHALSWVVPMLAPTHIYLCMHLQTPLPCAYIHMYIRTVQSDIHLHRHIQVTYTYREKNNLDLDILG